MDFIFFGGHWSENKRKWKDKQILGSCQKAEEAVKHEDDYDTNFCWSTGKGLPLLEKETWRIGYQRKNRYHPDDSRVKIS